MRLPYRHHLHGTSDPETVKLLSRLLVPRSVGDSPSDLAEVIDTASELVLWHLARELRNTDPQAPYANTTFSFRSRDDWIRATTRLLTRVLREADEEGVLWTPVLDILSDTAAWTFAADHGPRLGFPVPTFQKRAELLISWVSEVTDPEALFGLLDFRADAVHAIVAGHARAMSADIVRRLHLTPAIAQRLVQNPALDADAKSVAVERAYSFWQTAMSKAAENPSFDRDQEPGADEASTITILLDHGFELPPAVRASACNIGRFSFASPRVKLTHAIRFLVHDRSTPAEILTEIASYVHPNDAAYLIAHPNSPEPLWKGLASKIENIPAVLDRHQPPRDRIVFIYNRHRHVIQQQQDLAWKFLGQEDAPPWIWQAEIMRASPSTRGIVLDSLARNERAHRHPLIRADLLRHDSVVTVTFLLLDRRPEEFERLMLRYYWLAPNQAVAWLREHGIPSGTPVPEKLLAEILSSSDADHRLQGLTLVAKFQEAAQKSSTRPPRSGKSRPI